VRPCISLGVGFLIASALGCGSAGETNGGGTAAGSVECHPDPPVTISSIVSFTPGDGAGFGHDRFPEIVYGEPRGGGVHEGSTDVLSLGTGGEIVVGFGADAIVDGDGVDFIVFENPFYIANKESMPYEELAEVAVTQDGTNWTSFPCKTDAYPYDGCAGWKAVFPSDTTTCPFDPDSLGGDRFDLADVGVAEAKFVRIRDLASRAGEAPTAGFDLDAIVVTHPEKR